MSQYRLKKPLPDYEAGATISKEDNEYYRFDNPLPGGYRPRYSIAYVENNSDWFEKIEPKHPLLELLERESNEFVNWSNRVSFDKAINIVRNYLQSQPLFCEEVKGEESITLKKIEQIYDEYVFQVPYDGSQQYYNQEKIDAVKPFFELLKKHIMSSVISNSKKEIIFLMKILLE